jgi:hypothetical protein
MSSKWRCEDGTDTTVRQMTKEYLINSILWLARGKAFGREEKDGMNTVKWAHDMAKDLRRRELKETLKENHNTIKEGL